jgi:hypothetical protein
MVRTLPGLDKDNQVLYELFSRMWRLLKLSVPHEDLLLIPDTVVSTSVLHTIVPCDDGNQ